jgi:hypothetical protein
MLTPRTKRSSCSDDFLNGNSVTVGEVTPGGAADKCGRVAQGDILKACSAVILKAGKEGQFENEGYGQVWTGMVRGGLNCCQDRFVQAVGYLSL